jgi:hypothetical protein
LGCPRFQPGQLGAAEAQGKLTALPRATPITGSAAELQAENNRLRRALANAKLDLAIVNKAAAYYGKESR